MASSGIPPEAAFGDARFGETLWPRRLIVLISAVLNTLFLACGRTEQGADAAIVRALVGLAADLGHDVIAEGVEASGHGAMHGDSAAA